MNEDSLFQWKELGCLPIRGRAAPLIVYEASESGLGEDLPIQTLEV